MNISVIIATYNRAAMLAGVLQRLERQRVPAGTSWEVLVVDNNSTDGTAETAAGYRDRLPVRVVREPTPGKSHALNTGLAVSGAEWVLFTDDDVELPDGWVAAYAEGMARYPEADILGGPVTPTFGEGASPFWQRAAEQVREVRLAFTVAGEGLAEGLQVAEMGLFPGANFAMRRRIGRRFCTRVGPVPGGHWILEEILLQTQAIGDGARLAFLPKAAVGHPVPPSRQSHAYLRDYHYWAGRSAIRASTEPRGMRVYNEFFRGYTENWPARPRLLGVPQVYWRVLARSLGLWSRGTLGDWRGRLKGEADAAAVWGMMVETRRSGREGARRIGAGVAA
jgi:hypothetical protein